MGTRRSGLAKGHALGAIELATFGEITRARCVRLDRVDLGQIVYVLTELPLDARRVDLRAKSLIDIKVKLQKEVQRLGNRAAEFCSTLHICVGHGLAVQVGAPMGLHG